MCMQGVGAAGTLAEAFDPEHGLAHVMILDRPKVPGGLPGQDAHAHGEPMLPWHTASLQTVAVISLR
jgi:hypothetical protein